MMIGAIVFAIATAAAPAAEVKTPAPGPLTEVRGKIEAIFGSALRLSAAHHSAFVTGDFNGDGWVDLAAVVVPDAGALDGINSPVANWILKEIPSRSSAGAPDPSGSARVLPGEVLLAVIHGYGETGWRSRDARQTYLLRGGAGEKMESAAASRLGVEPEGHRLSGDAIVSTRAGRRGFLFWTGATYHWQPL